MLTIKETLRLSAGFAAALAAPFALAHHHESEAAAGHGTLAQSLGYTAVAVVLGLAVLLIAVRRFRQGTRRQ